MTITRRSLLAAGAAMPVLGLTHPLSAAEPTLRQAAADRQLIYGTAVSSGNLLKDEPFARLVADQANMLVAEGETKRKAIEPKPGHFNFASTEKLVAFAEKNGQRMRGQGIQINALVYSARGPWNTQLLQGPVEVRSTDGHGPLDTGSLSLQRGSDGRSLHGQLWSNGSQAAEPILLRR